ncbi:MAG: hypothetical protein QGH93_09720 [Gammaproteobacteria bacterium]|nr:hypothetical protein [Gammaproteobacteria bacterium]
MDLILNIISGPLGYVMYLYSPDHVVDDGNVEGWFFLHGSPRNKPSPLTADHRTLPCDRG